MNETAEDLRSLLKIVNGYDVSKYVYARGGIGIYLTYRSYDKMTSSAWQVQSSRIKTDSEAAWYNYGAKTFLVWDSKSKVLEEAKKWAEEKYGIVGWAKIPGLGGYVFPKTDADIVRVDLAKAKKAAKACRSSRSSL